ncbi:MAG: hypothetical protein IT438_10515 [Phycisphaerales bacterium]|nr:hypothetical protein [Phycisphaerales bacterium]
MSNDRLDNPDLDLPPGVTPDDVVDLVDGQLPKSREAVVIEGLQRSPRLGLLVKQLRADRAEVAELAEVRIPQPVGMVDAVEAKLNREALSALVAESEEAPAAIPISSVIPHRRNVLSVLAESAWGRRLATAASLAIVAGLGFVAVQELSKAWPKPSKLGPLVTNTASENDRGHAPEVPAVEKTEVAVVPATPDKPESSESPITSAGDPAETAVAAAAPTGLTLAEALKLAEAGRLVIRVRSDNFEGTLRHLQDLSRASGRDERWRAFELNALPIEYAALASPLPESSPAPESPTRPDRPSHAVPTYAGDQGPGTAPKPAVVKHDATEGPSLPAARTHVRAVRIVQTSAETRALDDLLRDIAVNKSHRAAFCVLPESAATEPSPALDPESILWWSRGSSAWAKRVSVPVVVEVTE